MALTEAGKWLEESLLNLSSDVRSGLQLDADLVYNLVSYCELASPPDASEYLMVYSFSRPFCVMETRDDLCQFPDPYMRGIELQNIVVDDRCNDIVAEYVRRRGGGPTSVPGETLQAYVKPREDESWSAGSKKPQKQKAEGNASAQKNADRTLSSSTATGATASQNSSTQKGKTAGGKGKRGGKGVSLAEASKGLEGEGPCEYCGALVLREGSDYAGLEGVAVPPASEAEIKAEEFKNRLVEYDRSSAARTTVIDDQSDYFQIDGNTWLTDKEKQLLKKRQEDEERIAEERRKRVVVTIDLLGRKVVMAGQENGEDGVGSVSILGGDMFVGKDVANVPRIKPNPFLEESPMFVDGGKPAVPSRSGKWAQNSSAAGRLAAKKSARIQHDDPIVEALVGHNLQDIGISNIDELNNAWQAPRANASAPVEEDEKFAECRSEMRGLGIGGAVSTTSSIGPSHAEDKSAPPIFDICLPRKHGKHNPVVLAPSLIKQKQTDRKEALSESYNRTLRPGMILLKKWLSVDQQVDIVKQCKLLGTGPGGFYQPQYDENSKMHLRMMCLGMQWQPTSRAYESRRTNYDNAMAPPLPESFLRLVEKAISVAKLHIAQESGGKAKRVVINGNSPVPDMVPNVCIVNFYEHSGNLGMHQDKDESPESLKRGSPVVSFSVGDSAEFLYGSDNNVETAEKLVLDSGDVLIFGGPSRMIYHGVSKIIRGSAPESLLQKSNLRPGRLNLTFREN
ncbi:hypothetical protein AXG93_857s1170 [Marchantia polymorpha subsp. ruderalis]|uniref:Fe2OG dioxygenase domain-containing protein n=1 Tax=Marchantia polymorpha subsp. ruderalis TaxID=1480154 RepID=A0A176WD10_MARPO|nr:hypothetical protein AXG93_857s1170 [Marchantia polymorpha subsp. ruderalis]